MSNSVKLWTEVVIFLSENNDKHFTDNIFELSKKYNIYEKLCNCPNQQLIEKDINGCCKDCKLKRAK